MLHQIGTGTLGPVYCAYDPQRDRVLAVKLFTPDLAADRARQLVADFERLITADLGHPGIVAPVATGIAGSSPFLAHQYVEAESFDAALGKYGPAPPDAARRVITELAGCLDFAAAVDIQHGALHPRDVLVLPNETRLTGLGVARALERAGVPIPVRDAYSAPERVQGFAWDRRADVFTLAALLHELLWGRQISGPGPDTAAALTEIADVNVAVLRKAFVRAMADRPEDRFGSGLEFVEAIGSAFTARPAVTAERRAEASASRRRPAGAEAAFPAAADAASHAAAPIRDRSALDLDLRAAGRARYADAEVGPAVAPGAAFNASAAGAPAAARAVANPPPDTRGTKTPVAWTPQRQPERSRRIWPLAAILAMGIGLGFGFGYLFKAPSVSTRQAVPEPQPHPVAAAPPLKEAPVPAATTGRDFTESAVREAPAPATPPAAAGSRVTPPAAAAPAAFEGRLLIRSEPAGASVLVDGREYGTTPTIVRGLERGTHRVRVIRDGYLPDERNVSVTRIQPAPSLLVTLEPRRPAAEQVSQSPIPATGPYTGSLVVESLPPGASVYLDNKPVGRTPLTLNGVHAGEHVVRLERDGYRRWGRSIRVVTAERNRVTASLER